MGSGSLGKQGRQTPSGIISCDQAAQRIKYKSPATAPFLEVK